MEKGATTLPQTSGQFEALKRLHDSILQSAGEGIYGIDAEGRANFVNPAAQTILGWTEADLIGEIIHDFHHHSHADGSPYPRASCPIYAAIRDGQAHKADDEVFWHKDGRPIPVEYVSTPVRMDDEIVGAVVVFSDISLRKAAEKERQDALAEISRLKNRLERERDYLRDEYLAEHRFGDIIGQSAAMQRLHRQIDAVAATRASVLIQGESGVGKELVARELHRRSDRSNKAMVKVNCAAIPNGLFESEFFGHVRGAFSGANADRVGRFELADQGTLFLDEVGDIPLHVQGKLLRALQEQELERLGESRTRKVDVRIIAASNRELRSEIQAGRFREDLYYRLSVFPIEVAPLRERRDDIVPLAIHFLEQSASELGKPELRLTREQGSLLQAYRWPGNVRELQHVVSRAAILATGKSINFDELAMAAREPAADFGSGHPLSSAYMNEKEFRELEKSNLTRVMVASGWRVAGPGGAAERLGVKPTTLDYRLRKFGIRRPAR